jgi:hypothetical protein
MSRDWISKRGPKRHRHTTITFVLLHPSLVRFVVVEISPFCRRVAHFRVVGRQGVNTVRLGSRIGRHSLRPGTYKLVARSIPGGRRVVDTRLVVVRRASQDRIAAARGANTCATSSAAAAASSAGVAGSASSGSGSSSGSSGGPSTGSKTETHAKSKPPRHRGVLGARFAQKAVNAASHVPLWLYALLVLAIILLAAAALPLRAAPDGAASALARHRGALALAGAATLVVVTVMYVLL